MSAKLVGVLCVVLFPFLGIVAVLGWLLGSLIPHTVATSIIIPGITMLTLSALAVVPAAIISDKIEKRLDKEAL